MSSGYAFPQRPVPLYNYKLKGNKGSTQLMRILKVDRSGEEEEEEEERWEEGVETCNKKFPANFPRNMFFPAEYPPHFWLLLLLLLLLLQWCRLLLFFFWYCFRQDLKRHADDNGRWATSPGRLDGDGDVSATRRLGAALVGATVAAGMRPLRWFIGNVGCPFCLPSFSLSFCLCTLGSFFFFFLIHSLLYRLFLYLCYLQTRSTLVWHLTSRIVEAGKIGRVVIMALMTFWCTSPKMNPLTFSAADDSSSDYRFSFLFPLGTRWVLFFLPRSITAHYMDR